MSAKKTILVADDDPTIRRLLEKVFLSKGYSVILAENGKVALEILEKHHVDLLMTDIKMEPIDGIQLLKIVGKKYPDLPAIALNAWVTVPLIDECIKLGVYDFIGLPFKIESMLATVRHALIYGDGSLLSHAGDTMPEFIEALENKLHQCKEILRGKKYEHSGGNHMTTKRKTILVVDDERGPRESLRFVLKYDYDILLADGGASGLEILETQHVDLLISNIAMPNMNGFDFVGIVRAKYPTLPVLMLTGYYDLDRGVNSIKLGVFDYLSKPFDPHEIQTIIKHALAYGEFLAAADAGNNQADISDTDLHRWSEFKKYLFTIDHQQILTLFKKCEGDVVRAKQLLEETEDRHLHTFIDKIFSSLAPR